MLSEITSSVEGLSKCYRVVTIQKMKLKILKNKGDETAPHTTVMNVSPSNN
jgi:hypothetical protein